MAEYSLRFTEKYAMESVARFRQQLRSRLWLCPLRLIGFVGLVGLVGICLYDFVIAPAVIFGAMLVVLVSGPKIDNWLMKRRFRRSPFHDGDFRITVTREGFASTGAKTRVELAWSAFTQARRFPDGFLVQFGTQQYYWWPDVALAVGSVGEVEQLLRLNVPQYHST